MPSKKIGDLSVADLKAELAKRSGDISGNKASLLERLRGLLEGEGLDPDNMDFDETAEGKQEVTLQSLASLMGGMKDSIEQKMGGMEERMGGMKESMEEKMGGMKESMFSGN
uniref:Scaffold attachment factor B1 n=1 Tax=Cacopsylla melanoneura TaxID=428564 RepID=A0A8D8RBC9_9HEMI